MQIAAAGDRALLVTLGNVTAAELHEAAAAVRAIDCVVVAIPGQESLYVVFASPDISALGARSDAVRDALGKAARATTAASPNVTHRLCVSFDGEDFAAFLVHTHLSREDFLRRIRDVRLTARYLGFRAGFAYLDGWPREWAMPRRATSRPVARGSFAIAGATAGFYPIDTPGGWNLLGRTDAVLWDERRETPALIAAGDDIVIEPSAEALAPPDVAVARRRLELSGIEIVSAPLAVVTGGEEWRRAEYGVAPGGAFDDVAAAIANRAVGNPPDAPLLECAMSGPRIRASEDGFVAWCTPDLHVETRRVARGEELAFGRITGGLRAYLAFGRKDARASAEELRGTPRKRDVIRAIDGPHVTGLTGVECEVTPSLDRVGIRLRPLQPLSIEVPADLLSCGMQCGTVQLHPDGSLVAMGPDHPVTGGYLQVMTVVRADRWKLAQLVPGERVRFEVQRPNS